jgi:RNA polymerase sigma factor (sigma-70 family)
VPEQGHQESLSDDQLLTNIQQGCSACFAQLFHRYCRQVYSVALRILCDRAETEDMVQEVFLSIFLQQERFDPSRATLRTRILRFAYFKVLLRRRYLSVRHFFKQEEMSETIQIRRRSPSEAFGLTALESKIRHLRLEKWPRLQAEGTTNLDFGQKRLASGCLPLAFRILPL